MGQENILEELAVRLAGLSDTPSLDAQVLLAQILDRPRAWVLAHPEIELTLLHKSDLEAALKRLEAGEPLPYMLGHWEFFGLDFIVTPDVLIPRPETELLVETALHWLRARPDRRIAADIGTGSGCIAVSLAVNVQDLHVIATDISQSALEVARRNAEKFNMARRIDFYCCDIFPAMDNGRRTMVHALSSTVDLIAANLPYIPTKTLRGLRVYGREPTSALNGGRDGLNLIRRLLAAAPRYLAQGGLMLLEIEASEGPRVLSLAYDAFAEAEIRLHQDLSGHDRLVEIQLVTGH